jgi:hypothetical protein
MGQMSSFVERLVSWRDLIVTETLKVVLARQGLGTPWAGRCRMALRALSRCRMSRCRRKRHSRLRGSSLRPAAPFAAHEVLEARWKAGPVEERDLWQGLAQVCVAMTHEARGNQIGADRLYDRAAVRLAAFAATRRWAYGLDVNAAAEQARSHVGSF